MATRKPTTKKVLTVFNPDNFSGTPTLEQIFEGPSEEQLQDYIQALAIVSNKPVTLSEVTNSTKGRSLPTATTHPDTNLLNYLQSKYRAETNNPFFDIRSEIRNLGKTKDV